MLPVSNLVRVQVTLSPLAAARRSFGVLMIVGDSAVINASERYRTYTTLSGVVSDFGTNTPEYRAANLYFSQSPKPSTLMIGRWLRTASNGQLIGGILTPAQKTLSNFTSITNGGLVITIDGVTKTLTGLNFSAATNLNGVADIINLSLTGGSVSYNGNQFIVTSNTTGTSSVVGFGTTGSGTDLSVPLKLTSALALTAVGGQLAETPAAAVALLADRTPNWYGIMFNASVQPTVSQATDVAAFIEAQNLHRMYGATITDPNALSAGYTTDLGSVLTGLNYKQSFTQYSGSEPAAVASLFGRIFSVNFAANRSTITAMYKQEPGVPAEDLSVTQAAALKAKRINVFTSYTNNTNILQYGTMSGLAYIDETHGLDWLQDAVQTNGYNALYTSKTKIPQTDAGMAMLTTAISKACSDGVVNGLIAPGYWNADGFGTLETGGYLKSGFYVYAQPIASQSQSDRDARLATPITVAVKLAGAIHEMDVLIDVNR